MECNIFCHVITQISSRIGDLLTALDRYEPKSGSLYCHMGQVFSRLVSIMAVSEDNWEINVFICKTFMKFLFCCHCLFIILTCHQY